ncbi:RDD family protein [Streptomyces sp. LHD-70]|uniref:RDD family protein n=1 Tax=Streptomyces sp. LHD-70 TaxID=3072140 RepID=UPI00280FB9EF|nr:RDD family protein [Streptomyces sp. LHD-70]MDQ8704261.1 RDD family protein [Streptomyces sp. LHD-70]
MSFGNPNNPYGQQSQGQPGYGYPQQQAGHPTPSSLGFVQLPTLGTVQLASMGSRFGARLIDGVVLGVICGILGTVGLLSAIGLANEADQCNWRDADYYECRDDAYMNALVVGLGVTAALVLITLLYEWLMISFVGATLGKKALGIKVVRDDTGQAPGIGGGFVRWIMPQLGGILCGIGTLLVYLSPSWDNSGRQQGWHDKAAHTVVIKKP